MSAAAYACLLATVALLAWSGCPGWILMLGILIGASLAAVIVMGGDGE